MEKTEIRVVETEEELLKLYPLIKKVPLINVRHSDLLVKCLTNGAVMLVGQVDSKDAGVAIVERMGNNMNLLAVWAENSAVKLAEGFYSWAKELGIERISMMSAFDRPAYERLFGVTLVTAIFEKDLKEWQPE